MLCEVLSTGYWVPSTGHTTLFVGYHVLSTQYSVPRTWRSKCHPIEFVFSITPHIKAPLMAGARDFTELQMWKSARQWSKQIVQRTKRKSFARDRRLVAQINDSSDSAMANIAEGFGRGTQGEFVTFLGYSLGSVDETR